MVRLTFMLEGRETISTEDLAERPGDPVERVMLLAVKKHIHRRLGDLLCPRHGQSPRVIARGPSPDRLTFSVEGCCEKLKARAARALDGENPDPSAPAT